MSPIRWTALALEAAPVGAVVVVVVAGADAAS